MSAGRDVNSRVAEAASAFAFGVGTRPVGVRPARRRDAVHSMMLNRVVPASGVSRLDVAAFNSSI